MIEALKRVAALPGAEAEQPALLDVIRVLAEISVAAFQVKHKANKMHVERLAFDAAAQVGKPSG